jgi:hypothetical protein
MGRRFLLGWAGFFLFTAAQAQSPQALRGPDTFEEFPILNLDQGPFLSKLLECSPIPVV